MKKLLMGSICLLIFSVSILIFQISCQKEIIAQNSSSNYVLPPATVSSLGGVIVGNGLSVTSDGTLSVNGNPAANQNKILFLVGNQFYTSNYDGSDYHSITPNLPAGWEIDGKGFLSPDCQKLFFIAHNYTISAENYVMSCNADGTNLQQVMTGQVDYNFMGVY